MSMMQDRKLTIQESLSGGNNFKIPIYQRNYSWSKTNCQKLFMDVIESAQQFQKYKSAEQNIRINHFIGTMVCIEKNEYIEIVDGQQRLTTIMLMLKALRDNLEELNNVNCLNHIKEIDQLLTFQENSSDSNYSYITDIEKRQIQYLDIDPQKYKRLRLRPNTKDIQDYYNLIFNIKEIDKKSKIYSNYAFFKTSFKKYIDKDQVANNIDTNSPKTYDDEKLAPSYIINVLNNLKFVLLIIKNSNLAYNNKNKLDIVYPQDIFESLNSSGVKLSQDELLKNSMLLKINPNSRNDLYERCWLEIEKYLNFEYKKQESKKANQQQNNILNEFIKDYLVLETRSPVQKAYKQIFDNFITYQIQNNLSIEQVLERIKCMAKYYSYIKGIRTLEATDLDPNPDASIIKLVKDINLELESTRVIYASATILLLLFFDKYFSNNKIQLKKLLQCIKLINSLFLRLRLNNFDFQANALAVLIALCKALKQPANISMEQDTFALLKQTLMLPFIDITSNAKFISNEGFEHDLLTSQLYNGTAIKIIVKHVLKRINIVISNGKEVDDPKQSIEHIMPQSLTDDWIKMLGEQYQDVHAKYLHTLGNLTIMNGSWNSKSSNKSFAQKKLEYAQSKYETTRELRNLERFDEQAILQRVSQMYSVLVEIWPHPADID